MGWKQLSLIVVHGLQGTIFGGHFKPCLVPITDSCGTTAKCFLTSKNVTFVLTIVLNHISWGDYQANNQVLYR